MSLPKSYGILLFPGFQALDVFGPLDSLSLLSKKYPMNLSLIAATLDPVSTAVPGSNTTVSSQFVQSIVPTHTLATAPALDVLIVPGGSGTRSASVAPVIEYIAKTYPTVRYLLTVCTGSLLAAKSGVLDGKRATTNKIAYDEVTAMRTQVNWVNHARWVVDGNIWTSSGITAGIDLGLAFIEEVYSKSDADRVAKALEYVRNEDPNNDPFAKQT